MGVKVCLVCLKTFENVQGEVEDNQDGNDLSEGTCALPLIWKFLKFAENYLQILSLPKINSDEEARDVFCEKCELSVINPICQVYLELLSAQLRLSWEMERLAKLLKSSRGPTSDKLRVANIKALAKRLGIGNVAQLEDFRSLLAQKCQLKRKEALPDVIVSRCNDVKPDIKREPVCGDRDLVDDDLDSDIDNTTDPLDLQEFTENPENYEEDTIVETENRRIEIKIKIEPTSDVANSELDHGTTFQLQQDSPFVSKSNRKPNPSRPIKNDGSKQSKLRCRKCDRVMRSITQFPKHNRFYHESMNCKTCGQTFEGKKRLDSHIYRQHHKVGSYPCKVCAKVFETYNKLVIHRNKYHNKATSRTCQHCNKPFYTDAVLAKHIIAKHSSERLTCPHCPGRVFHSMGYLKRHTPACRKKRGQHF